MYGHYTNGKDKAHRCCAKYERILGVPMLGTFNVRTDQDITDHPPSLEIQDKVMNRFWLIRINGKHLAWVYRWEGTERGTKCLEIISARLLPDELKTGELDIEVCTLPTPGDHLRLMQACAVAES